jgi:hypothetical protein
MNNANNIYLHFVSSSGTVYNVTYNGSSQINGRFYLTCNGTYSIFFRNGSTNLASLQGLYTSQIVTPTCNSKPPDATSSNDMQVTAEYPPGEQKKVKYTAVPGACQYKMYKSVDNGGNWSTIPEWTHNTFQGYFNITEEAMYKVNALSCNGDLLDQDMVTPDQIPDTETTPTTNTGCDECQNLTALISCPAWQDYLNDLGDTITAAVPPAPNWNTVAQTISQQIALRGELDRFGDELIEKLKAEEQDPTPPATPPAYNPNLNDPLTDLNNTIVTEINPNPSDYDLDFGTASTGAGAFTLTDPLNWVPDNNDKINGYISDSTSLTDPGYNPPTVTPGSIPNYTTTGTAEDLPNYTVTNPAADTPPNYTTTGTTDTIPIYTSSTNTNTIPLYNYGGP